MLEPVGTGRFKNQVTEVLLGLNPPGKLQEKKQKFYCAAGYTVREDGALVLTICPHTAHFRSHELSQEKHMITEVRGPHQIPLLGTGTKVIPEKLTVGGDIKDVRKALNQYYIIRNTLDQMIEELHLHEILAAIGEVLTRPPTIEFHGYVNEDTNRASVQVYGIKTI